MLGYHWMKAYGFTDAYYDPQGRSAFLQSISVDEALYFPNDNASVNTQDMLRQINDNEGKGDCGFTVGRARR